MSANCGVCGLKCLEDKSTVKCGVCESSFHTSCVKIEGVKTRAGWKCDSCSRKNPSSVSSKSSATTTELSKEFLVSLIDSFKKEVFEEIKSSSDRLKQEFSDKLKDYSEKIDEFGRSVEFLSANIDKSNELMKDIRREYGEIKKENHELRQENKMLNASINILHDRVRELEQYSRKTNIEISGVPVTPRENTLSLHKDIGSAIGQELQDDQVMAAHRVPSFNSKRMPSLVVQFQTRVQRDSWLNSYKQRGQLAAKDINKRFDNSRVYINEHLSPDSKRFLRQLKEACKEKGVRFVWFRDGKFYVRKSEGEKCHKISKLDVVCK